jgi:hypothetical protein
VFSIVQSTMGSGNSGLLPCCGESFGPCGLITLKNHYMKMISSLGNPYLTVKLAEMPTPLSIIFFIIVFTHPMMCFLVQFWPFRLCKAISRLPIVTLDNDMMIGRRLGSL